MKSPAEEFAELAEKATQGEIQVDAGNLFTAEPSQRCCGSWVDGPHGEPSCCGRPETDWNLCLTAQTNGADAAFIAWCFNNRALLLAGLRGGEWRSMESAPKETVWRDGRQEYGPDILAYPVFGKISVVKWWQVKDAPSISNFLEPGGNAAYPTHWQPLPAPPLLEE